MPQTVGQSVVRSGLRLHAMLLVVDGIRCRQGQRRTEGLFQGHRRGTVGLL